MFIVRTENKVIVNREHDSYDKRAVCFILGSAEEGTCVPVLLCLLYQSIHFF